jgi:thioredoxin 1
MKATADSTFQHDIQTGTVLVDVWAPWCSPCKALAPVLEELANDMKGQVKFLKLNADESMATCEHLGVMQLPTLVLYQNGQIVDRFVGTKNKAALHEFIEKAAVTKV